MKTMIPVLLGVLLAVSMPALAQEAPLLMADSFGVSDASGAAGSTVSVPLEIANVSNGPIQTIMLYMDYNESVISLESVDTGPLTAGWISKLGEDKHSITITTFDRSKSISNSSTGDAAYFNFLIVGGPSDTCLMTPVDMDFSNTANRHGTATAKNGTVTVTVNDQDENSGGSSGSAGGGSSGEDFYNIVLSKTDRQSVFKNSDVSFIFDLEGNIVEHINFTALNSAGTIAAKVEILNNTSSLVSTLPPHEVFRNLNIWVGNAGWGTKRNIADATVVFTVDKSWITENNIDESSIALYRYSDDTWHELVTRKISEDANSLQFEAGTPGFSPFAVTGKELEGEPGGEGIIEPTVTAEKTPIPTPTEKKGIPGFSLFAGLSVLLIAMKLLHKKN